MIVGGREGVEKWVGRGGRGGWNGARWVLGGGGRQELALAHGAAGDDGGTMMCERDGDGDADADGDGDDGDGEP